MTFETWKAEHYSVPAEAATETWLAATEHSLRKWEGALPEALAEHGLTLDGATLLRRDEDVFSFHSSTCALCLKAEKLAVAAGAGVANSCTYCPLYTLRGGHSCCSRAAMDADRSPWHDFTRYGNPMPMIAVLKQLKDSL